MSTILHIGNQPSGKLPHIDDLRVAIAVADWNSHITGSLLKGALDVFRSQGYVVDDQVDVFHVPGTVELTYAASKLDDTGDYDAIIVLGCVIRGGTPHFDYVCQSVTQGVTMINVNGTAPVIFGVLTVDCEQDAIDRAGGKLGNKGAEAAETAIRMIDFSLTVDDTDPEGPDTFGNY